MTEKNEQTAVAVETPATPVPPPPPETPKKTLSKEQRKKKKKMIKNIIIAVVAVAVVGVGGFFIYDKLIKEAPQDKGEAMTSVVMRGSIQSMVQGYGITKAKESATISPNAGGTILELMVKEGDKVEEGTPLYRMDDAEARKAVADAEKTVSNTGKELQALYDAIADLNVTAPHAGKMIKVADLKVKDDVTKGQVVATVVDDTKLRLHLYYSYAYEDAIHVGQSAQVSIPATMDAISGKVEAIHKVEYIVPEGSVLFEVVIVLDNPGTLTEGMDATATLTDGNGGPIYPYKADVLKYYQTSEVKAKVAGPVEQVGLLNYASVTPGQTLIRLGAKNNDEDIAAKENALATAQTKLKEAQDELGKYNAVAPISGTVISCNLTDGAKVENGQGLTIADTSVMTVEMMVDERNINSVKTGMMVNLSQGDGNMFMGTIESVSLTGKAENGVAAFPCIAKVDNPDGTLMTNMYLQYSFVASQSDDCLVVPVQAVQYVSLPGEDGMGGMPEGMDPGMMEGQDGVNGEVPPPEGDAPEGDADANAPEGDADADAAADADTSGDAPADDGGDSEPAEPAEPDLDAPAADGGAVMIPGGMADAAVPRAGMSVSIGRPMGGRPGGSSRGGATTIVYVQGTGDDFKTPPPNAIEADPSWEFPEGYYPVVVEVGIADTTNVEIKSGLNEGDVVFIGYATQNAWG